VDSAGNESAPSRPVKGQPFNTLSPLPPAQARAMAHNISILAQLDIVLDWQANEETDLVNYRVYRGTDPGLMVARENRVAEIESPRFVDVDIRVGTVYYYRITAVDKGGKESLPSELVFEVALPQPDLLKPVQGELAAAIPSFRWKAVPHARAYRVIVTSSPTSGEITDMPLTSDTTAVFAGRVLPSGEEAILQSGQIYYWKVIVSTREDGTENAVSRVESFKVR